MERTAPTKPASPLIDMTRLQAIQALVIFAGHIA